MPYIVLNFAYGTGPYLRTVELALAFNDELEKRGRPRMPIIVPLVYGERQKRVMLEEFGVNELIHPGEILLDHVSGALLGSIFYANNTYAEALEKWINEAEEVGMRIREHFSKQVFVETLQGEKFQIDGREIVVELNRSPRVIFGIAPSYMTTFGYIAEILEGALKIGEDKISAPRGIMSRGAEIARQIEDSQRMRALAYPATFSGSLNYKSRYKDEILTPPNSSQYLKLEEKKQKGLIPILEKMGIFVTITGIPGLERLYAEARKVGFVLYSNFPEEVLGSVRASPDVVVGGDVVLQFARSGWGSVWLSMLSGTPIIVPEYDVHDDPEIYFNNRMVEELGIGIIYRGQPLSEILDARETIRKNCAKIKNEIMARWGTLDGNVISAKLFVNDFLKNYG